MGENRTNVLVMVVMEAFDQQEYVQVFVTSAFLRETMADAGVNGIPEMLVVEETEAGTS